MRDENLETAQFLARTGLFELDRELAPRADVTEAVQLALEAGAQPELGLRIGTATPLQAFGALGELIAHCPDLRSAMAAAQLFWPVLQTSAKLTLREAGHLAELEYQPGLVSAPEARFATELVLSFSLAVIRRFVGRMTCPLRVLLPYEAPEYSAEYEALFRCPVVFGAGSAALIFDRKLLDVLQPFADDQLRNLVEKQLECRMRRDEHCVPLHQRVRAILEQEGAILAERRYRELARRIGLSRRVLNRRLSVEGRTLSGLFEEFRKDQAVHYLLHTDIPLKDVADRLGFSEQSAFHRAFKRWMGTTPLQFRRNQHRRTRAHAA
jgi:AraC-like DNA-binding protein